MEGGTVTLTCQEPSVVMMVPRGANVRWNLYYSFVSKENKLQLYNHGGNMGNG